MDESSGTDISENDLSDLKAECSKRKRDRSMATIQDLTLRTYSARRQWIELSQPLMSEVLEKYPSLKFRQTVRTKLIIIIILVIIIYSY